MLSLHIIIIIMIQVIVRAIDILEFVAQHGNEPVQLIKIAEHVGLNQPTCANIVRTLVDKNYLEQVGRKQGYLIGIGAYQLTGNPAYQQELIEAAIEPMQDLKKEINETSLLGMIKNNKRVVLHLEECDQVLQVKTGMLAPVYYTSIGRLMMAFMPEKELNNLLKSLGLPTKSDWPGAETKEGLLLELQKIRTEEFVKIRSATHTVGFAVPIYKNKIVVAALSIFVPESRYTEKDKDKLYKAIRATADKIRKRLER